MPPKRASPLDEPPTASSSSEEEGASSEEEETSSEEDDEPAKPPSDSQPLAAEKKSPAKKHPPTTTITKPHAATITKPHAATITKPQPKASSSESETESDSESDSEDDRSRGTPDPIGKPTGSKPIEETPKAKKTKSQPSATPARSATKRPSENNHAVSDSKRARKKRKDAAGNDETPAAEDDGKKAGDDSKKLFQRLWSEDDEIALLKGMTVFLAKTGVNPYREINAFHDFIKKSLHIDVSNEQLTNKIRRLKKKYQNITAKIKKNGADPRLTKPHENKAFELSKKIWATEGENGGIEQNKSSEKDEKIQKEGNNTGPSSKPRAELDSKQVGKIFIDQNVGSSPILSEMIRFDKNLGLSGLNEDAIRRGVELIDPSKRAELEDRWKKLQVAELELFVKRADLIKDQTTLVWEAYESSN